MTRISVAANDRLDGQQNNLLCDRMYQYRRNDLVVVLFLTVDMTNHAVIAFDTVRTEVARSINGDQIFDNHVEIRQWKIWGTVLRDKTGVGYRMKVSYE